MLDKSRLLLLILALASSSLIWGALSAVPAQAQEPTPENDANCVACHKHEYYLYDTGKWFCLCDAPMHCIYCHGGRTDSTDEKIAHEGLVLYPTREHAQRCQNCHPEDYMERVVTFSTVAGVSSMQQTIITATPGQPVASVSEQQPEIPLPNLSWLEPYQFAGLVLLTILMIGVIIFGYRCWKTDCALIIRDS